METLPISLCMIVKNEESMLGDCLQSVCDMVNEMVVVDTGSSDNTIDIAKKYGARVFNHEWNDNFAEARNAALSYCRNPWILQLDADEELDKRWRDWFCEAYPWAGKDGFLIAIDNLTDLNQAEIFTAHYAIRFFKNKSTIQYENDIHETVNLNWEHTGHSEARIIHKGYAVDERKLKRDQRNLPLLKHNLAKNPTDPHALANMALYYGSQKNYTKANEFAEKALQQHIKGPLMRHCLRFCMYQALQSKNIDRLKYLADSVDETKFPEAAYFMGLMKKDTGDVQNARKLLESFLSHVGRLTNAARKQMVATDNICNARLELSEIYRRNDNLKQAEQQLAIASKDCPTRVKIKLERLELLVNKGELQKALSVSEQIREQVEHIEDKRLHDIKADLKNLEHRINQRRRFT